MCLTHEQDLLFLHHLNNKESIQSESILTVIKNCTYASLTWFCNIKDTLSIGA